MEIISKEEAVLKIKDKDTLGVSGSGGSGSCEGLLQALADRYKKEKKPKNITVISGISPGNSTENRVGMNYLVEEGLVGKAICGHVGLGRLFGQVIGKNQFPAFGIPLGVYGHLLRSIAGGEIGVLTHVGLHTFADPRIEGCRLNEKAKQEDDIVELVSIHGKENLLYKSFPIDVCFIKGTYSDNDGNISLIHEPIIGEQAELANATHNSGGIVIAQVEKIVPFIPAKEVEVHHKLVDYVVLCEPDVSLGDYNFPIFRKELIGLERIPLDQGKSLILNERKVIGRRACMELKKGYIVNLGVGMPEVVSGVANEEGILKDITLSVETGALGGKMLSGVGFGGSINPECINTMTNTFDLYNGGLLNMAVLGLAQVDQHGNVNVSKFGTRITGPGGFINISQNTKKIAFVGTFTAKGLQLEINQGIKIIQEGLEKKFVKEVEQITFSSKYAKEMGQEVFYITERAVFKLENEKIILMEIAPNIDLKKDILNQMDFEPIVSNDLKIMDSRLFEEAKMNLKMD